MTTRIETQRPEDTRIYVYGLTAADCTDLINLLGDGPLRRKFESAMKPDDELGYFPYELITAFTMEDAKNAFDNDVYIPQPEDLNDVLRRRLRDSITDDLADTLCQGNWDADLCEREPWPPTD